MDRLGYFQLMSLKLKRSKSIPNAKKGPLRAMNLNDNNNFRFTCSFKIFMKYFLFAFMTVRRNFSQAWWVPCCIARFWYRFPQWLFRIEQPAPIDHLRAHIHRDYSVNNNNEGNSIITLIAIYFSFDCQNLPTKYLKLIDINCWLR